MPAVRYTPIPNPQEAAEAAERELEDAFDVSDDERDAEPTSRAETRPMIRPSSAPDSPINNISNNNFNSTPRSTSNNNLYNFEYDYTIPPPGSPPRPSTFAIPDNIFGNTNGYVPVDPAIPSSSARPGWFRRNVGRLLPGGSSSTTGTTVGGGIGNDGVFANMTSKPTTSNAASLNRAEEGTSNMHIAPEFEQKDVPPSYGEAQADAVPPYWDTTVVAPANSGEELIVEGFPPGHVFSFITSLLISFSFQFLGTSTADFLELSDDLLFVGFLLTSVLASTHAAKFGSRAGLGITLVQYGFYLRSNVKEELAANVNGWSVSAEPHPTFTSAQEADDWYASKTSQPGGYPEIPSLSNGDYAVPQEVALATDWLSFFLMTIGWLLFLTSILGFWRVKRWEHSIQQSTVRSSIFERPVGAFREGVSRDIRRIFARLPQEPESPVDSGRELGSAQPSPFSRPEPPPMDEETRRQYEAALQIDRQ